MPFDPSRPQAATSAKVPGATTFTGLACPTASLRVVADGRGDAFAGRR